jgi:AraC family transcriptional regulator of adaptative response/methylated-DNA-[protein]-cysteine methyltransferase
MQANTESRRPSNQVSRLVSSAGVFELQRQTVPAPLKAKLTLRLRGVDSEPVHICYGFVHSWFGECLIAWTDHGICWLEPQQGSRSLAELEQTWLPASLTCSPAAADQYARNNLATDASNVLLHLCGTSFQLQVWAALLRIPPGYYLHYGDLARQIGKPGAARAIGQAVGANGVSVLVPCHRVLAAGGSIGGYRWGSNLKLALLRREAMATRLSTSNLT